jgi:type IV pilus assembly protein PilO
MFDKVPFYGQVLIFFGLSLAIVGMAYFVFPNLSEMKEDITEYEADLTEKNRKIQEGLAIEQRLPEFEQEIASLEAKLSDVAQILPTNQETGDLLSWIKNVGDQSNLDLKSFSPGGLQPAEFYSQFPIDMQIIGRYHDLGLFLDRVSKYSRIINVDNLSVTSILGQGEKTIQATFRATTFVYDDEAQVTEAVQ